MIKLVLKSCLLCTHVDQITLRSWRCNHSGSLTLILEWSRCSSAPNHLEVLIIFFFNCPERLKCLTSWPLYIFGFPITLFPRLPICIFDNPTIFCLWFHDHFFNYCPLDHLISLASWSPRLNHFALLVFSLPYVHLIKKPKVHVIIFRSDSTSSSCFFYCLFFQK